MTENAQSSGRGRPRTMDREHALAVAMLSYWQEGVDGVSLNEICRRARVSKPALYREFGSEDGLLEAVLQQYQQQILDPMIELLQGDTSFSEILENIAVFVASRRDGQGLPRGCLFVKTMNSRSRLGMLAQTQLDKIDKLLIKSYSGLLKKAQASGQLNPEIAPPLAAHYLHSQVSQGLTQQARGTSPAKIQAIMQLALRVLVKQA